MGCGDNKAAPGIVGAELDFGQTDCGTAALPRLLLVTNPTGSAFNYTTTLAAGAASLYLVEPPVGAVLAGGQLELTVYTKPIPATSAVTDNLYGDTLTFTTDVPGDGPHAIAIKQTAHGAILTYSVPSVDFPTATAIGAAAQTTPVTINNTGNSATSVTPTSSDSFSFTPGGSQSIAASGALAGQIAYSPKALGPISDTLTLTATGPLCGPLPTLTATGSATLAGTAKSVAFATGRGRLKSGGGLIAFQTGGATAMCVVTRPGFVACTGDDANGMRGAGTAITKPNGFNLVRTPTGVLDGVVEVSGGRGFFCARRQSGQLACWGDYLGLGKRANGDPRRFNPVAVEVATGTGKSVTSSYTTTCTVDDPGGVTSCFGIGNRSPLPIASWTLPNTTAVSISSGGGYALGSDGTVTSFGENSTSERGIDPVTTMPPASESPPTAITGLTGITQVSAGGGSGTPSRSNRYGCAVKTDGTLSCWGKNRHGQLGDGTTVTNATPVQVLTAVATPLTGVSAVSAGQSHVCAMVTGAVSCWGRGTEGELGIPACSATQLPPCANQNNSFAQPTIPPITNATAITMKARASCAVLATGALRCWGELLGAGHDTPTPIAAFEP